MKLIDGIKEDSNLYYFEEHRVLSVYDDNDYIASDVDFMGTGMRNYVINYLRQFSFDFASGRVLKSKLYDQQFIFPKVPLLGYSPLTLMNNVSIKENEVYILTPTQCAGFFLTNLPYLEAKTLIRELMSNQPLNFMKLKKLANREGKYLDFQKEANALYKEQEDIIKSGLLRGKTHLESIL